jgi:acyl dehydratase
MSNEIRNLTVDAVREGEALPTLSYDVSASTIVLGALAARDWRPMHHDKDFAVNRNGTKDIFLNTPNQAAWFERYLTDWTGPKGRLGKIRFRMKDSVFPGDTMDFNGSVSAVETDEAGCGWANVELKLSVGEKTVTDCTARIALPVNDVDNPWKRIGKDWQP